MPSIRGVLGRLVPDVLRRNAVPIGLVTYAVVLFGFVGVLSYFAVGLPVDDAAVRAVQEDPGVNVTVTDEGDWILRDPDPETERTAMVFYPGGRVKPRSYVPSLAPLAKSGNVTVIIPEMPVNLAVLDSNAAGRFLDRHPEVDRWYVGGHSLGGAMACRYAGGHADRLSGMVLFGAYCASDAGGTGLDTLVVTGTRDGVLDRTSFAENRGNLPAGATLVSVEGVNHTGFGSYFGQSGDDPATVSRAEGHRRLRRILLSWVGNRTVPDADWVTVETAGSTRVTPATGTPGHTTPVLTDP